uniref:hypothetical protein n=1 Tax=Acinetobacter sp. CFCC 10889 TaxID=1775557 RepID=UPI001BC881A8
YFYILNERLSVDSTDNLAYKIYLNEYGIVVDLINKITQEVLLSRKKIMYLKSNAFAFAIDSKINPSTHHYAII